MNIESLYIVPKEKGCGTLFVTLGLMEILKRSYTSVAFFKPVMKLEEGKRDSDIETLLQLYGMKQSYEECCGLGLESCEEMLAEGREDALYEELIARYEKLKSKYDFVLCMGFMDSRLLEFAQYDLNVEIAKNFSSALVGLLNGGGKAVEELEEEIEIWSRSLAQEGMEPFAFFVNRVDTMLCPLKKGMKSSVPCLSIPYHEELDRPTVMDLLEATDSETVHARESIKLQQSVANIKVAAMRPEHFLEYLEDGDLVIVPADRCDILLAILGSEHARGFATASAVIIVGDMEVASRIRALIEADPDFAVVLARSKNETMEVTKRALNATARITARHSRKIALALGHFSTHVESSLIECSLKRSINSIVTPAMFLHRLFKRAASDKKRIVLPESSDDRILQAAEIAIKRGFADITLLGEEKRIYQRAKSLGIDLSAAQIVDPSQRSLLERLAARFYELRRHKGITYEMAQDTLHNLSYFATMMIAEGLADGMVSGATHTTRETVLPALEIFKTKEGIDIVSSLFFICLDTRVLVYADCAIVVEPDSAKLAQIAVSSAETASLFGIEPVVALLSYSSGESGVGEEVEKVREAAQIAMKMRPDIPIEGPLQYDAAIDPEVAAIKMPKSKVAGRANVFIFPDLNTGNNTYKAVQRSTGAIAIGPVLQGLSRPVNDLSRGCSVEDIVSTIAITAIQAASL